MRKSFIWCVINEINVFFANDHLREPLITLIIHQESPAKSIETTD